MLREESKMPWAISGLLNLFRRLGPVLFITGLLFVTCCGRDVNITVTSSPQNIISRTTPAGFDAIHEGRLLQVGDTLVISFLYNLSPSEFVTISLETNDRTVNHIDTHCFREYANMTTKSKCYLPQLILELLCDFNQFWSNYCNKYHVVAKY
jgi:hypothetical protein